jgi:hypothetical protein
MGRPSLKTPELLQTICDRIANGESLRAICQDADMPHRDTVDNWLIADPEFSAKHARAREAQGDLMDERILAAAEAVTPDMAAAERVRIDAYKWRAARLNPKRYGDKLGLVGGDGQGPIGHAVAVSFVQPDKGE